MNELEEVKCKMTWSSLELDYYADARTASQGSWGLALFAFCRVLFPRVLSGTVRVEFVDGGCSAVGNNRTMEREKVRKR